ncbi:hypothetical protein [Lutimonas vermicola]|uniref:Uncharacterized protein n=1 Tax=Lutimonas vermicola TaxID=414288 RepID=A0ABU9L7B2_9FLAO
MKICFFFWKTASQVLTCEAIGSEAIGSEAIGSEAIGSEAMRNDTFSPFDSRSDGPMT